MRLSIETVLLLAAGIVVYSYLTVYNPIYLPTATFYLLLAVACTVVIFLLEQRFPIDKPNVWIVETAAYSFTAMSMLSVLFAFMYSFKILAILAEINALYFLLVALGEDLMTYGLPLALEQHTPLKKLIYVVFLGLFAVLHYPSYKDPFLLLQPLLAACINMYLVLKYRNVTGVIIGHFLTDLVIAGVI